MSTSDNGATKALQRLYHITTKKDKNTGSMNISPGVIDRDSLELRPIKMTTDVQRAYENWKRDLVGTDDLKDRMQRYADLDFMVKNSGFMQQAVKLYSNETISPDESGKIIKVYSRDKKVEQYINTFFKRIGVNRSILENCAYDIATFADHFWIRSITPDEGIVEITPLDVKEIRERIEFSAIEELKEKYNKNQWSAFSTASIRMDDIVDAITTKIVNNDYAAMYKRYLFGFILGEDGKLVLPPWAVSHFRRFSTQSEFAPFGRPLLINSLALFREYKSALNLLAMARVAKFPKEIFKIKINENMTPTERMIAVNEARQEYMNLVEINNGKEEFGIGSSIWTITDLFEYELQQNTMDLGEIADVELLKEELISSTLIPKGYLISGESSWGDAGKALLQQSKVFAREVYTNQTAILTELTDLVKTQFVLMNLFDKEDTEFELSLAFPNSEQATENINNQKDTMDLANAVITNLQTALAVDSIPPAVAKDIFKHYSSLDAKELDKWFDQIEKSVDLEIKQPEYKEPKYEKIIEKINTRMNEAVFREAYFDAKKDIAFTEGTINNQHFMLNYGNTAQEKVQFTLMKAVLKETKKVLQENS